ncbi:MAG: HYR domain-containing protein [Saprospiraceae bacterium]|nr:HYR domain-containing protein [Saprospiraceae bacterium]
MSDVGAIASMSYRLRGATVADSTFAGYLSVAGTFFNKDTTFITYFVTDTLGSTDSCLFSVLVRDRTQPIPVCPNDTTITVQAPDNSLIVNDIALISATDNCGVIDSISYTLTGVTTSTGNNDASGNLFNLGVTTIRYFIFDESGNSNTCLFDVELVQVSLEIECPMDTTVETLGELCGAVVENIGLRSISVDADEIISTSYQLAGATTKDTTANNILDASGNFFNAGTTIVTYTVNIADATQSCSFEVVVEDKMPPMLECPEDVVLTVLAQGETTRVVENISPIIADNCDELITLGYRLSGATIKEALGDASGSSFNLGETIVTYFVADTKLNIDSCAFTVNIITTLLAYDCPNDTLVSTALDTCGQIVENIGIRNLTDPSALREMSYTLTGATNAQATNEGVIDASGLYFNVGITTVTYTLEDTLGGITTCSFEVEVEDQIAPTFTCPQDTLILISAADTVAIVENLAIFNLFDNCDDTLDIVYQLSGAISGEGQMDVSGNAFPIGTTTVTYFVADQTGNIDSCSFNVVVIRSELAITCPQDTTLSTSMDTCGTIVNGIALIVSNAALVANSSYQFSGATEADSTSNGLIDASGNFFNSDTTLVTYTVIDTFGITQTCSFLVVVQDSIKPTFTCPQDMVILVPEADTAKVITEIGLTDIIDNCTTEPNVTYILTGATMGAGENDASGTSFQLGVTQVTYIVQDNSGNTDSCTFNITIQTAPIGIVCPTDTIVTAAMDDCTAIINDLEVGIPDTSIIKSITYTLTGATTLDSMGMGDVSGLTFNKDTTIVTYTVMDTLGNTETCAFQVIVQDKTPPTLDCPTEKFVNIPTGDTTIMVTTVGIEVADNCDENPAISYTITGTTTREGENSANGMFQRGNSRVRYTVTDESGNTSTCNFNVQVADFSATLDCPNDTTVLKSPGLCGRTVTNIRPRVVPINRLATISYTLTGATSFESRTDTIAIASGQFFNTDTTTVTYTITTIADEVLTCSFNVIVQDTTTLRFVNCPSNININVAADTCVAIATWTAPMLSDTCGATITASHQIGEAFPVGMTNVTYVATNIEGETDTCRFIVNVLDTTPPSIMGCPTDTILYVGIDTCLTSYTWIAPTASDICGLDTLFSNIQPGQVLSVGTNRVTYTAIDASGNIDTCSFNIVVRDTIAPIIFNCPADTIVASRASNCGAIVTWTPPIATDNCGVTLRSNLQSGAQLPVGTTTITYTATDLDGNTTTCSFNITVEDRTAPMLNCPDTVRVAVQSASCEVPVTWEDPTITDNCGEIDTLIASHQQGDLFPVGETTVTYIAIDQAGNADTCSFLVIVSAEVNVTNCPRDITQTALPGRCGRIVNWTPPAIQSPCSEFTVTSNFQPGDVFEVGTTQVVYIIENKRGDTTECKFNITILDQELPTFANCPSDTTISVQPGACGATFNWTRPSISDNCGISTLDSTHASGNLFPLGSTKVTYTAADASGNIQICEFTIRVIDNLAPVFAVCPDTIRVRVDGVLISDPSGVITGTIQSNECSTVTIPFSAPIATDACSNVTVTQVDNTGLSSGSAFPIGISTLVFNATDQAGNTTTCRLVVEVLSTNSVNIPGKQSATL